MAKLTISAVSTLTAMPSVKPSFSVTPNPNMMPASQEKAPVLLSVESAGSVEAQEFAERFAAKCSHIDTIEAVRRINAFGETLSGCAEEGKNVQLGFMNLEINISGTVPDTNAPLNEANEAFYSAVVSDAIRKTFSSLDTHIPTSVCPADVKRVRDVDSGANVILGTKPFYIQGVKLTYGKPGEKVELFDKTGATKLADVKVLDATSEISLKAQLPEALESGRYYLLVTTLAGGKTTLYPVGLNVTVEGEELELTRIHSEALDEDDACNEFGDQLVLCGTGFGVDLTAAFVIRDASGVELARQPESRDTVFIRKSAHEATFEITKNETGKADSLWRDNSVFVELTSGGKTVAKQVAWKQA